MAYFNNFPSVLYQFPDDSTKQYKNLSIRPAIVEKLRNDFTNLQVYNVEDGETPETIAFDVYNDENLNWIIMLTNDVLNLYTDWPMSEKILEDYLYEKYRVQTATDGSSQTLTNTEVLEYLDFVGLPENSYQSTIDRDNGTSVIIRPIHFVDTNKVIYSYDSIFVKTDAFGRTIDLPFVTPVSYRAHETNLNDEKRKIFIPTTKIANQMKKELGALVND